MLKNNRSKYFNIRVRRKDVCRGIVYAMSCVQRYEEKGHSEGQLNLVVRPESGLQEFKSTYAVLMA